MTKRKEICCYCTHFQKEYVNVSKKLHILLKNDVNMEKI